MDVGLMTLTRGMLDEMWPWWPESYSNTVIPDINPRYVQTKQLTLPTKTMVFNGHVRQAN
jgi:hypothetical protein